MQLLCPGVSRTGSASLAAALALLGYAQPYHGFSIARSYSDGAIWLQLAKRKYGNAARVITAADFDQVLGDSAAITDMPAACFWRELLEAYPEVSSAVVIPCIRMALMETGDNHSRAASGREMVPFIQRHLP